MKIKRVYLLIGVILFFKIEVFPQKFVSDYYYNEFGGGLSGDLILGDWIEKYNFKNVARITGLGLVGVGRINFKKTRFSVKNSISLHFVKNSFTMDFAKYGQEYDQDLMKKSSLYSSTYLVLLGSQGEFNFFNYGIYQDSQQNNKWTPYLGLGLGGIFYYSGLNSSLPGGIQVENNIPDIIKNEEDLGSKIGLSFYTNFSLGVKLNVTQRDIVTIQLAYYYFYSDRVDWLEYKTTGDAMQQLQVVYTYIL